MKLFYRLIAVCLLLSVFNSQQSFASNDFLEESQNYSVTPKGNGVVHFKIPVWSYGWQNNYRLGSPTTIWYSDDYHSTYTGDVTHFVYLRSTDMENTSDPSKNSPCEMRLKAGEGTIKVTKTAAGGTIQIDAGGDMQSILLPAQKSVDGSYKRVVFLEFDWYLPESLTSKQFYVGVDNYIYKYSVSDAKSTNAYTHIWYCFRDALDGADDLLAPELQSPYLYFMDEGGNYVRDGKAAIPYVVYQTPKSYTTSLNSQSIQVTNRAGSIIVPTTDSVQRNFYATFTLQPNTDVTTTTTRTTNKVDIPAYHRLYDLTAEEQKDRHDSYTGTKLLTWTVRNPQATDLVPTDYFEIQRALKADYSDAQTIQLVPMNSDSIFYEYADSTHIAASEDTDEKCYSLDYNNYVLKNEEGDALYIMNLKLLADTKIMPATPVYYRVRRASSAAWEWDQPFALSTSAMCKSYLAPLAVTQPAYTLDPDYQNNRKVHFNIHIDNAEITETPITLNDCRVEPTFVESRASFDSITMTIEVADPVYSNLNGLSLRTHNPESEIPLRAGNNTVKLPVGENTSAGLWFQINTATTYTFNRHTTDFEVSLFGSLDQNRANFLNGSILSVFLTGSSSYNGKKILSANVNLRGTNQNTMTSVAQARWEEVKDEVKQQLYDSLMHRYQTSAYGRCMWDRGAKLILIRTAVETGSSVEIIVPQDSIRRNADGSWTAHITDEANKACTHYTYAVHVDASDAELRFQNPSSADTVLLTGPSLYFNEAATITSFIATQGDASSEMKRGVLLQWVPSSPSVDSYTLLRVPKNTTYSPTTIYEGTENSAFDSTALPGQHYEYTVVAHYECNGEQSEHSASAEGWRTSYGEISGYVLQTDNSGMAGVQVSLSAEGQTLKTMLTDAAGAFRFDSLAYGSGTVYTVTPTSQYGTFSYNSTSSGAAVVTLDGNHCMAQNVTFVNTSSVRLTGRVLYDQSTIPVAGACFLLNGDTVKRGGAVYTTGTDGNFELTVPKSMPCRLQVAKQGHTFANDGWLFANGTDTAFSLVKALDGVRYYDQTKVRLVGRVAGGIEQQALPPALGLGKNNLGDDLQLVLQLEGDNTAHIVHDPDDLTRDTMKQKIQYSAVSGQQVVTNTVFEQKRIIIRPDVTTGEYAVDLFPVKYKLVQATATGYATLLDMQTGAPTFDLTNAPLTTLSSDTLGLHAEYNARFDRIYRNPMQIGLQQYTYGMAQEVLGEQKLPVSSFVNQSQYVQLYEKDSVGNISYLFGYPIFLQDYTYHFRVGVYEDYYYNNNTLNTRDRVRMSGGKLKVYNGFKAGTSTATGTYALDDKGEAMISIPVDNLSLLATGEQALRSLDMTVEREGTMLDYCAMRGFVTGNKVENGDIRALDANIQILDVLRDPPGSGSSCSLEKGATYKSSATMNLTWKVGLNIEFKIGTAYDQSVGIVTPSTYSGVSMTAGKAYSFSIPIVFSGKYTKTTSCTYSTTEKISTSSSPSFVGASGDVFIGHANEVLYGTVRAVRVIDDSTFVLRKPAIDAGYIKEVASATGADGKRYHFVIAKETVIGNRMGTMFAYTQHHIANTLLPKLIRERNALLVDLPDSASAQAIANTQGRAVYWNQATTEAQKGMKDYYKKVNPTNISDYNELDKVNALNNVILKWVSILAANEREKIVAIQSGKKVGTYSVSGGTSYDHSETFTVDCSSGGTTSYGLDLASIGRSFAGGQEIEGTTQYADALKALIAAQAKQQENAVANLYDDLIVDGEVPGAKWESSFKPVLDLSLDGTMTSSGETYSRKIGFTISPDSYANTTVSVYRAPVDSIFQKQVASTSKILIGTTPKLKEEYSTFVFFREAGTSHCPYEGEERTKWYNPGQLVLGNATIPIENPKITLDKYTISNVPADQPAVFQLTLINDNLNTDGRPAREQLLSLSVEPTTNPDGATILIDGEPLTSSGMMTFYADPGIPIVKTLKVYRGIADDYEDITLRFASTTCTSVYALCKLSVHFLPESSPVSVAFPRDKWVMNTLSAKDSTGYYLPITIDGFDINHKNFDHIEFQYKLSTENEDAWVNHCSFYADDSLYNLATGNKAMIENGRIEPFRFYGERDPKELNYDLRAVSFCRHGSGYVTKASPVISGTKDTRPPVLFGKAQPANGILTLADDITLRFSEPIAGNWLDEDNNFQLRGVTNATGITTGTSLHFDGNAGHCAVTKATREILFTDFTIDMLVRPAETGRTMTLLSHGNSDEGFAFQLTADNRLQLLAISEGEQRVMEQSKPMGALSTTDFTRVIMAYDFDEQTLRFYAGTLDITDGASTAWLPQNGASTFIVGADIDTTALYHGNIMELRIWSKALTPDEISNTHLRRLTGYERELMDYYPMNEGEGTVLTDLASGAALYAKGLTWTNPQGLSVALDGEPLQLQPACFSRTAAQDYTFMGWLRSDNNSSDTVAFLSTAIGDSVTLWLGYQNGQLSFRQGDINVQMVNDQMVNGMWHHLALCVSQTYNTGNVYLDGQLVMTFPVADLNGLTGTKMTVGEGLKGNIDDICLFEQALPASLVQEFYRATPNGDEMGLIALLTFSETKRNSNNVLELVFSVNDQRVFKDANGNVVNKAVPLVLNEQPSLAAMVDKTNYAPVADRGLLTNIPFTWTYHDEELLISLKTQDREINKRTLYLTVRDVEDLNGNRLPSPVSWSVYADLNSLRWDQRSVEMQISDSLSGAKLVEDFGFKVGITNTTGRTRQFTIDNLPSWLTVNTPQGTLTALEQKQLTFTLLNALAIGHHNAVVYLTDDNGLSESLVIDIEVVSECPWTAPSSNNFTENMSVCGRVVLNGQKVNGQTANILDTDTRDKVITLYRNKCVGMASPTANADFYLTIYGNEAMKNRQLNFFLWQASTGKTYQLNPSQGGEPLTIKFTEGAVAGCGTDEPILFNTGSSESQNISLNAGWNWISTNLNLQSAKSALNSVMTAAEPWKEGDVIKNPATMQFSTYSEVMDIYMGSLTAWDYTQVYMVYAAASNTLRLSGDRLPEDSMHVTLRGDGWWSPLPCLFDQTTPISEAMADYYNYASTGDLLKAHDSFAFFSSDKRWVGNLTALSPGEGYLFRRLGQGDVRVRFFNQAANAPRRNAIPAHEGASFHGNAATNMTMIAHIPNSASGLTSNSASALTGVAGQVLLAYIGSEIVGEAKPIEVGEELLYFLTVSSDASGTLRFESEDGTALTSEMPISYVADTHHGSLKAPIVLKAEDNRPYKIIEDDHVVIIRNNKKYDVTGKKL